MGKRKSTNDKYTSKGERRNTNRAIVKSVRREVTIAEKTAFIMDAYYKMKNPWVTIRNPNDKETNKRFIKIKANDLWGNPKEKFYRMKMA